MTRRATPQPGVDRMVSTSWSGRRWSSPAARQGRALARGLEGRLPLQHHYVRDQNSSSSRCRAYFSLALKHGIYRDRTPDLCNAKPTPTRRCGAPGRCSRQPRARSAFRDPFRHLGLRRIAGRSWKFFVLRAIDRLDDRTAHSADPVADDPDPADFRIGRRASGSRRRGRAVGPTAWCLPSPYWAFRQ